MSEASRPLRALEADAFSSATIDANANQEEEEVRTFKYSQEMFSNTSLNDLNEWTEEDAGFQQEKAWQFYVKLRDAKFLFLAMGVCLVLSSIGLQLAYPVILILSSSQGSSVLKTGCECFIDEVTLACLVLTVYFIQKVCPQF